MEKVKVEGTIENAFGKALDTYTRVDKDGKELPKVSKLPYSGEYEAFSNYAELTTANALPSNEEIVSLVNGKRKANARQKAIKDTLADNFIVEPTLENDIALRISTMADVFQASNKKLTREQAETMAKAAIANAGE